VPEKRNDQTEIFHKKRLRDSDVKDETEIDYGGDKNSRTLAHEVAMFCVGMVLSPT
jgi:hypothetical protein